MPIYSYQTEDGRVVERKFSMKDYPQQITLDDGTVAKLTISLTANMKLNWKVRGTDSELPDEGADFRDFE